MLYYWQTSTFNFICMLKFLSVFQFLVNPSIIVCATIIKEISDQKNEFIVSHVVVEQLLLIIPLYPPPWILRVTRCQNFRHTIRQLKSTLLS